MSSKTPKPTTIIRAPRDKDNPYFAFRRKTAQDRHLSFEARGVLSYLLSKPGDWEISVPDLMHEGDCGRDRVLRILKELETFGYMEKEKQTKNQEGKFETVPLIVREAPSTENPVTVEGKPSTENPSTGKPSTDNPQEQKRDSTESADSQRKSSDPDGSGETTLGPVIKPVQPHIAIIDAYWAGLPGGKPIGEDYPRHVKLAADIRDAGYSAEHVTRFMRALYDPSTDVFDYKKWHNRPIPLEEVAKLLPVWWDKHKPPHPPKMLVIPDGWIEGQDARVEAWYAERQAMIENLPEVRAAQERAAQAKIDAEQKSKDGAA